MASKKTIIGITGTHASGKDTVADYISKKNNLKSYSTSDEIRHEATKLGIDHSRASLFKLANEIRGQFGLGELARRALDKVGADKEMALITGIRNMGEIDYLKEHTNFYLISVDAPIEARYERAMKRERDGDGKTLEEFRIAGEKEMYDSEVGQQLIPCMRRADFFIINDSSLEDLNSRTDEIVKAILNLHQQNNLSNQ